MMDVLSEAITGALHDRRRHRHVIGDIVAGWSTLDRAFDRLVELAGTAAESLRRVPVSAEDQARAGHALAALLDPGDGRASLRALRARLTEVGTRMDAVAHRINRDTVNIGVVGVTKSGKSTLLRTISGLGEDVVPTSAYDPTTAAASELYHVEGSFLARVRLHDWTSFRAEYLVPLHTAAGLTEPAPRSEGEFAGHRYPRRSTETHGLRADAYLGKLRIAQESFDSYRDLLRGQPEITLARERLRSFVAYPVDEADRERPYHAVRTVRVEANFGEHAVRGLGLIDLPGSRERGLDAHRQFMRNLRNQVDVLLLVTRPADKDAFFSQADLETLVAADEARGGVAMGDFVSVVINPDLVAGKPDFLANALRKISDGVRDYGVRVRVSDVVDRADVLGGLLPEIMRHLAQHLADMDRAVIDGALGLATEVGAQLVDFADELTDLLRDWRQAVPDQDDALLAMAERKRDELALDLEKLANRYDRAAAGGDMDLDLVQGITVATSQARDWVERGLGRGSKEEWLAGQEGAFAAGGARTKEAEFARARAEINAIYGSIDLSLEESVHRLWCEVSDILRARLTVALVPACDRPDRSLADLRDLAARRRATRLADALDRLLQLKVDYGSVVLRVTRPIIRLISWNEQGTGLSRAASTAAALTRAATEGVVAGLVGGVAGTTPWWQLGAPLAVDSPPPAGVPRGTGYTPAGERAESVYHELSALLSVQIGNLETALRDEAHVMPNVLAAAVDAFRDATVWAEKIELDYRKLCAPDLALIWPERFGGEQSRLGDELAALAAQATELRLAVAAIADDDVPAPTHDAGTRSG